MSQPCTDRPNAARNYHEAAKQQPNKSARLDSEHAAPSAAESSVVPAVYSALSSSEAAPTILSSLSPAQRLYSDALISMFGFLDLGGVISAHASCRSWRDAAYQEPSRSFCLIRDPSQLTCLCSSPLRHHLNNYYSPADSECTLEQLASLSAFPSLTRLTIRVDLSCLAPLAALQGQAGYAEAIAATAAQWPARLTSLDMIFPAKWDQRRPGVWAFLHCGSEDEDEDEDEDENSRDAEVQALIDCVGRLGTLTELVLELPKLLDGDPELPEGSLTLQPLLQLTRLQTLQLVSYRLGAADCRVIKQMGSLTRLNLETLSVSLEDLQTLCTPPHQLASLQRIDLEGLDTAAHMEALLQLPALSTLGLLGSAPEVAAYLPRFSQLRTLHLHMNAEHSAAISAFMPHLTQCTQLTALHIRFSHFTLADLAELTRTLTALTSLAFHQVRFYGLEQPDSLACLRSLPRLRELKFVRCTGLRLVHLTDPAFTSLSSLRSLYLYLPAASLPEARSLLTLPSNLMPQLTDVRVDGFN